jgi:hypothetical protein
MTLQYQILQVIENVKSKNNKRKSYMFNLSAHDGLVDSFGKGDI